VHCGELAAKPGAAVKDYKELQSSPEESLILNKSINCFKNKKRLNL
jgi:hypothetical protein